MAKLSRDRSELDARIVYWGVEGAGKTTCLEAIAAKLRADHRGKLRAVPTGLDPSVHYDVLPIELGSVAGVRTRFEIVGVPGAPEQAPTRMQLLDQVDGVVFVVDSQRERFDENLASLEELRAALAAYGRSLRDLPLVVQYNKRDLADPYVLEELHRKLDMRGVAAFESVASQGTAVLQALTTVSKAVIRFLRDAGDALAPVEVDAEPPARTAPALELDAEDRAPRGPGAAPTLVADLEVDEVKPPARGEGSFALASAGPAEILDAGRLRLPLVLVDPGTRRRVALVLTLELHGADEEDDLA
jgi:signal recognition particle receptor subunit beta